MPPVHSQNPRSFGFGNPQPKPSPPTFNTAHPMKVQSITRRLSELIEERVQLTVLSQECSLTREIYQV